MGSLILVVDGPWRRLNGSVPRTGKGQDLLILNSLRREGESSEFVSYELSAWLDDESTDLLTT